MSKLILWLLASASLIASEIDDLNHKFESLHKIMKDLIESDITMSPKDKEQALSILQSTRSNDQDRIDRIKQEPSEDRRKRMVERANHAFKDLFEEFGIPETP